MKLISELITENLKLKILLRERSTEVTTVRQESTANGIGGSNPSRPVGINCPHVDLPHLEKEANRVESKIPKDRLGNVRESQHDLPKASRSDASPQRKEFKIQHSCEGEKWIKAQSRSRRKSGNYCFDSDEMHQRMKNDQTKCNEKPKTLKL